MTLALWQWNLPVCTHPCREHLVFTAEEIPGFVGGAFSSNRAIYKGPLPPAPSLPRFLSIQLGILSNLILINNFPVKIASAIIDAWLPNLCRWDFLLKGRNSVFSPILCVQWPLSWPALSRVRADAPDLNLAVSFDRSWKPHSVIFASYCPTRFQIIVLGIIFLKLPRTPSYDKLKLKLKSEGNVCVLYMLTDWAHS